MVSYMWGFTYDFMNQLASFRVCSLMYDAQYVLLLNVVLVFLYDCEMELIVV
jgi:hypothetical protein